MKTAYFTYKQTRMKLKYRKRVVSISIALSIFIGLQAQDLPKILDAPVQLDKSDQKKIDRANELIKSGQALWSRLINEYNPKNITNYKIDSAYYVKAYPLLVQAGKNMQEANQMKFEVYRKNCMSFWSKHRYESPSGLEKAKSLQKEATVYFQKAQLNWQAATNYVKEYGKSFERYQEAISLEIIAVKKEGRALQLYTDWPIHYDYVWDEDIEKDLFTIPKPVEIAQQVETPKKDTVIQKEPEKKYEPEPYDSTVVYYQVQIVAHTVPLNDSYIRMNIYNGSMPIEMLHEEGWYKYVIGRYRTFEEANNLLKEVKIPKAFVVAYKNHKRVPIREAEAVQK